MNCIVLFANCLCSSRFGGTSRTSGQTISRNEMMKIIDDFREFEELVPYLTQGGFMSYFKVISTLP